MSQYEYNYTYVAPLAFVQKVPRQDRPTLAWYAKVVLISLKIAKNRLAYKPPAGENENELAGMGSDEGPGGNALLDLEHLGEEAMDLGAMDLEKLDLDAPAAAGDTEGLAGMGLIDLSLAAKVTSIAGTVAAKGITDPFGILDLILLKTNGPQGRPQALGDYTALFQTLPLPDIAARWQEDSAFAELRVAGFNPLVLQGIDAVDARFPVTDAHLARAGQAGDTLAAAGKEGRLYLCDYAVLEPIILGNFPHGPKYTFAPLALFVRPKSSDTLVPVAIQCGQDPAAYPIYTPADGDAWWRAKVTVNCADSNHHELISHLGLTHLIIGPFAIATPRRLPDGHAVRRLLAPHQVGTLSINDAAQSLLIAPGQQVDKALGGTIQSNRGVSATAVINYKFEDNFLPKRLTDRRVTDPALAYPYRDDALQVWGIIREWVEANVVDAYADDTAVVADADLQAWAREVSAEDGGRIFSFGEGTPGVISTRSWLTDALTMLVFTASAQHAAVNFAQREIMSFTPGAPVATYRAAPVNVADARRSDPLDLFPPMDMAVLQLEFLTLLGGVHHTTLGDYDRGTFPASLAPALKTFQAKLQLLDATIDQANAARIKYTLLKPSLIPQSINI